MRMLAEVNINSYHCFSSPEQILWGDIGDTENEVLLTNIIGFESLWLLIGTVIEPKYIVKVNQL